MKNITSKKMEARRAFTFVVLATLLTPVTSDEDFKSLYPAYKLIEQAVKSDLELTFKIRQAFFPAINYRYWQVDGAETIPFTICVSLHSDFQQDTVSLLKSNVTNVTGSECKLLTTFQWTNSLLLNVIPGDILLAMDATFATIIYSNILESSKYRRVKLDIHLSESPSLSMDDLEQAVALFLSTSKVMASPNSDPRYQGYVAKWYTYFFHDSYFSKLCSPKDHITNILLSIWITFTVLNLLIPLLSITRGKKLFQRLIKTNLTSKPRMYKTTLLAMTLLNFIYILSTLVLHISGLPTVLRCHLSTATHLCQIPPTATAYNYIIGILVTKAIVLPVAMLIELIAAVYIARESFPTNRRMSTKLTLVIKTFVIWQLLVFVQITVGFVSIPLLVLTFISPVTVLLSSGCIAITFVMVIFVIMLIPLPTTCKFQLRVFLQSTLITAEKLLVATFVAFASASYYLIVKNGMNMNGVKGYIMSLIPTIVITIFVWIIKKKFFEKRLNKKKKKKLKKVFIKRRGSLSTEEEMINLLSSSDESEMTMN